MAGNYQRHATYLSLLEVTWRHQHTRTPTLPSSPSPYPLLPWDSAPLGVVCEGAATGVIFASRGIWYPYCTKCWFAVPWGMHGRQPVFNGPAGPAMYIFLFVEKENEKKSKREKKTGSRLSGSYTKLLFFFVLFTIFRENIFNWCVHYNIIIIVCHSFRCIIIQPWTILSFSVLTIFCYVFFRYVMWRVYWSKPAGFVVPSPNVSWFLKHKQVYC